MYYTVQRAQNLDDWSDPDRFGTNLWKPVCPGINREITPRQKKGRMCCYLWQCTDAVFSLCLIHSFLRIYSILGSVQSALPSLILFNRQYDPMRYA